VDAPVRHPVQQVTTSGTCDKRILGGYGLVATVRAHNGTGQNQSGTIWVRWPVTGETTQEFTKVVRLAPDETVEFPVNETIIASRWFQTGECTYGWTPAR